MFYPNKKGMNRAKPSHATVPLRSKRHTMSHTYPGAVFLSATWNPQKEHLKCSILSEKRKF